MQQPPEYQPSIIEDSLTKIDLVNDSLLESQINNFQRLPELDPHVFCKDIQQYFNDVSYLIDLKQLYNPISTCFYSTQMRYMPALFSVNESLVKNYDKKCQYQLQIWDTLNFEMIYLKELYFQNLNTDGKNLIFTIGQNLLIYKLPNNQEENTLIEIDDLSQQVIPCEIEIKQIFTKLRQKNQESSIEDIEVIVVFQTKDAILDFNSLKLNDNPDESQIFQNFIQLVDLAPQFVRQRGPNTKIIKMSISVVNDIVFAISLLDDQTLDFYSDMVLRKRIIFEEYQTLGKITKFVDVGMSTKAFFMGSKDGEYYELKHHGQVHISFHSRKLIEDRSFKMRDITEKILHDYVFIYKGFYLVDFKENSYCLIAHTDTISVYNILQGIFTQHIKFNEEIIKIFEQSRENNPVDQNQNKTKTICIILKNLDVHIDILRYFDYDIQASFSIGQYFANDHQRVQYLQVGDYDSREGYYYFAYSNEKIICIHEGELYDDIETSEKNILKINYLNLVVEHSDNVKILITNETKIVLYELKNAGQQQDKQLSGQSSKRKINLEKKKDLYNTLDGQLIFDYALTLELSHHLIMVSKQFIVLLDNQGNIMKEPSEQIVKGDFIGKDFSYLLRQESLTSTEHGLYMFNLPLMVDMRIVSFIQLRQIDIGHNPQLKLFKDIERVGFMKSLSTYVVHPFLHLNDIKFMGVESYGKCLLSQQVGQNFMRLTESNLLVSWNVMTGKLNYKKRVNIFDQEKDRIFKRNSSDFLLLYNIESQSATKQSDFFLNDHSKNLIKGQITSMKQNNMITRFWKIIKIVDYDEILIKHFYFPYLENQRILINNEMTLMIVIFDSIRVYLYQREDVDNLLTKWNIIKKFYDFPFYFEQQGIEQFSIHYISPDFKHYLKFKNGSEQFLVKEVFSGNHVCLIEKGTISLKDKAKLRQAINRFQWVDSDKFQVVNEDGIQKTFRLEKIGKHSKFVEINYVIIPIRDKTKINNYLINAEDPFKSINYGIEGDLLTRLRECYQWYKQHYYLNTFSGNEKFNLLFRVHSSLESAFGIQSFTFLYWTIVEKLILGFFPVKEIPIFVLEIAVFNFLPDGNILHYLQRQPEKQIEIFQRCHSESEILYHLPFMPNMKGEDPFTRVLSFNQQCDKKQLFSVLQYLKFYEIDHHSRCIKHLYPLIIQTQTQIALDYFESRFQQTPQLKVITKGVIHQEQLVSSPLLDYSMINHIKGIQHKDERKTTINLQLLDLPGIYHFMDKSFDEFFKKLQEVDGYDFFTNKAIMAIIDFNFPLVKLALIKYSVIPFAAFHILFVIYMNQVYEQRNESGDYYYVNIVLASIQLGFSFYFICYEIRQSLYIGFSYVKSFWNYIDILAPISVIILQCFQFLEFQDYYLENDTNRCILSISTLLMWMKFLSIFRIFQSTNYLIRMVYEVIYDMGVFLFVYTLVVAAFGDAFLKISSGNEEDDKFISSFIPAVLYAYSMTLGGYDLENLGNVAVDLVWILWILCTIIGMIVMLNLLIAIVSGTHDKVIQNQRGAQYKEMAHIISENSYLVSENKRKAYVQQDKFMIVITDLEKQDEDVDQFEQKLDFIKAQIYKSSNKFDERMDNIEKRELARQKIQDDTFNHLLKRMGELKYQFLKSQSKEQKITVKIYPEPLIKLMLLEVQEQFKFKMYDTWFCRAKKFTGCKSGQTRQSGYRRILSETVYHCSECNFDFCEQCFKEYKNSHSHHLQQVTYQDLSMKYKGGWACDARDFRPCQRDNSYDNTDPYQAFYHRKTQSSSDEQFDLCVDCANYYIDQKN
ncbi:wd-40 repeat protein [Stylonychia lemnae]|uniref:Wd-40 repeat protein n=1 Tax=Stylonychia lemnae TaxID=5949 RepID=A0A078AM33_STYLE|nr:wd-40 repeat protein [Stylonychia lemnae]|eukprot:CDW82936.1 wd-40 repeat protein [Stylonychia lemnae]